MSGALIRQRVQDLAKAIRAKHIDGVMSFYAPNIVSFDFGPPLRYAGADHKRRAWQEIFAIYPGPIAYEVRELNVTTQGGIWQVVHDHVSVPANEHGQAFLNLTP